MAARRRISKVRGMSEEQAWQAVVTRDRASDGKFVFAVESTGIYCRPSCAARRPLRRNVRFFGSVDDAEQAGFRACFRCRPRDASGPTLAERARAYLDGHLDERVTLSDLAHAIGTSPFHLQREFVRGLGVSPRVYVENKRVEKLRAAKGGALDAAFAAGFGSSRAAYEATAKRGITPLEAAQGGFELRYAVGDGPHGRTIVAATKRGICWVAIGESDRTLLGELRREFPNAQLVTDDALLSVLAGRAVSDAKLDLRGTPFQQRVWKALRAIPRGETRTYGDLARDLGTSPRAVARACASNRIALLIPCHRVIAESGDLAGYRWGIERKRALLSRERQRPDIQKQSISRR